MVTIAEGLGSQHNARRDLARARYRRAGTVGSYPSGRIAFASGVEFNRYARSCSDRAWDIRLLTGAERRADSSSEFDRISPPQAYHRAGGQTSSGDDLSLPLLCDRWWFNFLWSRHSKPISTSSRL